MKPLLVGMILWTIAWTNWTASRVPGMGTGQVIRKWAPERSGTAVGSMLGLEHKGLSFIPSTHGNR